jgi:hypothetical protein
MSSISANQHTIVISGSDLKIEIKKYTSGGSMETVTEFSNGQAGEAGQPAQGQAAQGQAGQGPAGQGPADQGPASSVLEGGEEADDAVFSELLPNEDGQPVLVAVSQTAGTELGSTTTGGSGWTEQESVTVALIVDDFVSNMEGECSYTCQAETQEGLAEGSEELIQDVALNAIFTESNNDRTDLDQTLLVAAGAPEEITDSVEVLAEVVQEVSVPNEVVEEFINENWQEMPEDAFLVEELPPTGPFTGVFSGRFDNASPYPNPLDTNNNIITGPPGGYNANGEPLDPNGVVISGAPTYSQWIADLKKEAERAGIRSIRRKRIIIR